MAFDMGFTGTQIGMSEQQYEMFRHIVLMEDPFIFRHGICVGADSQAHRIVRTTLPNCEIIGHPGVTKEGIVYKRDLEVEADCDDLMEPEYFLDRNRKMVDMISMLVATPKETEEVVRSGTWATIRYAQKLNKPVKIILPDGTVI